MAVPVLVDRMNMGGMISPIQGKTSVIAEFQGWWNLKIKILRSTY